MIGLILAGGVGSRLAPLTKAVNKHLLPIFDKPMVFYPLSTLMLAGIKDIVIVSSPLGLAQLKDLLGTGLDIGVNLTYRCQKDATGIVGGMLAAVDVLEGQKVLAILGDNLFFGNDLQALLRQFVNIGSGAVIGAYRVDDPRRYGVIELDPQTAECISIEEKPSSPRSNLAITGLYSYDETLVEKLRAVTPSDRNELEVTDLNRIYLNGGQLEVVQFGRGIAWFDAGTMASLADATQFVRIMQSRYSAPLGCLEEIALKNGWISTEKVEQLTENLPSSPYKNCLRLLLGDGGATR